MKNRTVRILLRREGSREAIEAVVRPHGWKWVGFVPEDTNGPATWIWRIDDENTLQYAEDSAYGLRYLLLQGPANETLAELLRSEVSHWDRDAILSLWDDACNPELSEEAAKALGVGAPVEPDPNFVRRISQALENPDPRIRYGGIMAAAYTQWDEFRNAIAEIARTDPDEAVKAIAQDLLAAYDHFDAPPGRNDN